jgi:hypothetical protein
MKKKITSRKKPAARRDPNRYPKGWNRERVQALINYYDNQSDEEAIGELEAAFGGPGTAMIQVLLKLVPRVQKLLAKLAG